MEKQEEKIINNLEYFIYLLSLLLLLLLAGCNSKNETIAAPVLPTASYTINIISTLGPDYGFPTSTYTPTPTPTYTPTYTPTPTLTPTPTITPTPTPTLTPIPESFHESQIINQGQFAVFHARKQLGEHSYPFGILYTAEKVELDDGVAFRAKIQFTIQIDKQWRVLATSNDGGETFIIEPGGDPYEWILKNVSFVIANGASVQVDFLNSDSFTQGDYAGQTTISFVELYTLASAPTPTP